MKEESRIVEETRQKIASGKLTYDQMKEKLIAAINKEYEKEGEPNIELINACEELLAELATDGQPLPESHQEKYGEVIRQNIQVSHHSRSRRGIAKRLAVSLVVLVLLLGGGQVFLHREWFEHGTTDDEQQHTIQGFEVDPNSIAKCIAEEGNSSAMYFSDNYNDIKNHLGFDLPKQIILEGWEPVQYFVGIQSTYIKCSILYSDKRVESDIIIQIMMFSDMNNAYSTFEQDHNGKEERIEDILVYHSKDENYNTITWINQNCIWLCYGEVSDAQIVSVVELILGGNNHD